MRYLPLTPDDRRAMLAKIGAADVDVLFRDVPKAALAPLSVFNLPDTQGEMEVERPQQVGEGLGVAGGRVAEEAQDARGGLLVGALAGEGTEAEQAECGG